MMDSATKQAAIEARKRYYKQWRQNNPDKVRASNERYWARRAEREAQELNDPGTIEKKGPGDSDA